jgi:hypothetical protein
MASRSPLMSAIRLLSRLQRVAYKSEHSTVGISERPEIDIDGEICIANVAAALKGPAVEGQCSGASVADDGVVALRHKHWSGSNSSPLPCHHGPAQQVRRLGDAPP